MTYSIFSAWGQNRAGARARRHACSAALVLVALATGAAHARAQDPQMLQRGSPLSGVLAAEATHRYTVDLADGFFAYGEVDQIDVDVKVKVRNPDGDMVGEFDTPGRGAEPFYLESTAGGVYVVEVTPADDGDGRYAIDLIRSDPVAEDPADRLDQLMSLHDGNDRPGAVVGVVRKGRLDLVRTYGMANLSHGIPWERGTISNIGSVTKQFTAMGVLLLQADGKLSLDDDVREHIPELTDFGTPVRIRHLLNHTSGYREIYNLLPMTGYTGEDTFSRKKAIQIVQRQPELQAGPHTEWNYNNTGFILLSLIVEKYSGQSFADYMRQRVFEPLGMQNTRVKMIQGEVIPGSAQGYVPEQNAAYRETRDLSASAGAGGIYTTVDDLARWMLNYRDASVGGPEAINAIATPAVLENGESTNYGLGLGISEMGGRTLYAHTGGDVAHRAYLGYFPEIESGIILMSNAASFDLGLGGRLARLFFTEDLADESAADPETTEEPDAADLGMSPDRMEAVTGSWVIDVQGMSLDTEISLEDGKLFVQVSSQDRSEARATSDSTISIASGVASLVFHFEPDGGVQQATLLQGGAEMPVRRVEKTDLTGDQLAEFVGRYLSDELETFFDVRLVDGGLVAHHLDMEPLPLSHRSEDDFSAPNLFFAELAFQRGADGRVTGFSASNGRTKGVWFHKM